MITHTPTPQGATRRHSAAFNVALTVSAGTTFVGSLLFQADYAAAYGWDNGSQYLWPLGVDALGVAAWLAAEARRSWGPALCGAVAAAVSVTGNVAGHAIAGGGLTWGAALSGAFPPIAMALMVYLYFVVNPRPDEPEVWAEVADPIPQMSGARVVPAPDGAAPTPAPVTAVGSASGEPTHGVGVADPSAAVECAGTVLDPAGGDELWRRFERVRALTAPDPEPTTPAAEVDELPVELEAWAATVTDEELAEDARRRDKASVRKLLATYKVPDSRARRVAGLIRQGVTA